MILWNLSVRNQSDMQSPRETIVLPLILTRWKHLSQSFWLVVMWTCQDDQCIGNTMKTPKTTVSLLSRNRFDEIMQNLHLADNSNLDKEDTFGKVRPLIYKLNEQCLANYLPDQSVNIDESMVPSISKQCIPVVPSIEVPWGRTQVRFTGISTKYCWYIL